jgi:outer membrane protein insertion porin family/translocation and assembly module TamA
VPRSAWHSTLVALVALFCGSCSSTSTRAPVSAFDLREEATRTLLDAGDIEKGLATSDEYDPALLSRDLERIERYYRARGYYEAKVTAARVLDDHSGKVRVEIRVQPGPVVTLADVDLSGMSDVPFEHAPDVNTNIIKAKNQLTNGEPFDEARFNAVKDNILLILRDGGFPYATVEGKAQVDLVKHAAHVSYKFECGPFARYGEVRIVGLHEIPEGPVRDNLQLVRGEAYSRAQLNDARNTLLDLGVFSSVEIVPDLSHKDRAEVPLEIRVTESKLRTVRLGGGATFNVLALNMHLRTSWVHQNFLGGMRNLSISAVPGVDLYPTRFDGSAPVAPTRLLPENSLQIQLRQPAFLEGRTTGKLEADYDIKPLLFALPPGEDPRDERIVGYHSIKAKGSVERDFLTHWDVWGLGRTQRFSIEPGYAWTTKLPFTYQKDLPAGLVDVNVSAPTLLMTFDWRDNPQDPQRGFIITNSLELAGGIFQGNVSDLKIEPEIRGFLPFIEHIATFAGRLTFGFLFPRNYGDTLNPRTTEGQAATLDPNRPDVIEDQEKLLLRAFYSGGPNSNRGYPLHGVGPHGPVGFLIPTGVDCSIGPGGVEALPATCIRPLGGFTLWEASGEIRFKIAGDWGGVLFADASDVTRDVGHLRLNVPHISVGPGLRYMTPVGPLRVDIGYRVPRLQAIGQSSLPGDEQGNEVGTLFGVSWLPVAINVQIGQAF